MKMKMRNPWRIAMLMAATWLMTACGSGTTGTQGNADTTNTGVETGNTGSIGTTNPGTTAKDTVHNDVEPGKELPRVLIYNFHVTNRCPSCIAIEEATTKTLETYFKPEVKQGRIKRYILNVDDEKNSAIAEKYQAFGSGMFVTRVFSGKETTADLTGDGFKYAKNKQEKFVEILKNKITEYLK